MKKLLALAALMLASTVAQAGETYSFDIGGRTIRIEKPRDCDEASCVSVSIPGIYESGPKRAKRSRDDQDDADDDLRNNRKPVQEKPVQETRKPLTQPEPTSPTKDTMEPARAAPTPPVPATTASRPADPAPTPATDRAPETAAAAGPASTVSPQTKSPAPVVAAVPPSVPAQNQAAPAPDKPSPLGIWLTEEKEGKIRIEPCGEHLCGYSVNAKSNQNGEKILINMKSGGDNKWSGRIYDPKSGSRYDSTIALRGPDRLKVQGCAFGGMFCGGQTWTRVE
ncbi:conserved hypothetical protein [Rhodopseudomonas palustris HaA2]|uniref:DUF2147 domain-containing protein n=1 Tax=Rhodopseudomonas palustris (strain HaA2) TaxID=316058 RepID=Q2IW79_RHOP2|nr:DUF2147 domain-containing protein [Rhodopseudomonas palustris]ABD07531.1 conserved hypothetical protein [Rhodopseudomonas palustris HaA2]